MMRPRLLSLPSLSAILVGGLIGAATLMQTGTAEAGRAHFSGSAHFSGRFHGHGSVHFWRPAWRPRVWVGGSVWIGGGYYYPRSYYYYYAPYPQAESVPSYYPVAPSEGSGAPGVVAVVAPRPSMPTFGVGVFAGGVNVKDKQESSDLGLLARFRLTPGLLLEGEIGKASFKGETGICASKNVDCPAIAVTSTREDRRIGGSLIWEIGASNSLAPYLLAGGGVQQAKLNGDFTTTQEFGEIGVGLRLALSRNFHLALDVRAGRRKTVDSNQPATVARTVAPPSGNDNTGDTEDFTRGRLAAILNF